MTVPLWVVFALWALFALVQGIVVVAWMRIINRVVASLQTQITILAARPRLPTYEEAMHAKAVRDAEAHRG